MKLTRALLGLFMSAAAAACTIAEPPRTSPPASAVLSLPGFRVSPPPGRGWSGEADRASRTAAFSRKYGGPLRELFDEQRRAEVFVSGLTVPPELWESSGDTLISALKDLAAGRAGLDPAARWQLRPLPERWVEYTTLEGPLDATEDDLDLAAFSDEPEFREKILLGLFFPADLETTHRYGEIEVRLTETSGPFGLHADARLPLLDAVVSRLELTGPFVDLEGPSGDLARAVLAGDAEAARAALDEGADAVAGLPDWRPVEVAAWCDRRDLAGPLSRSGGLAALLADDTPLTPFLLALLAGRSEIAALFIDRPSGSGDKMIAGPPPLAFAAGLGDASVVAALLDRGAEIDARSPGGRTPLMLAAEAGSLECAEALVAAGAGLDLRAEDGGTALLTAVDWGRTGMMRFLLGSGADVNVQDQEGWSALLVAIFQGDTDLVGELIAAGADVDANVFATGQTALLQAIERDKPEIAAMLVEAGADVDRHKDGQPTPLMAASGRGWAELVRLLIAKGADVNVRADDKKTALSIAEDGGHAAVAAILLAAGARR